VIERQSKVSILRSPIPNAKLYQLPIVTVLLVEGVKGDTCLWNYETGQVLAMIDARESQFAHSGGVTVTDTD